ncbi:MAG: adenylate kinase [Porphyromonas sp.]|nr:adenylate kinase [Bacteroidales bacterium]MDY3100733.1 adenylate kinase [Porphyromonas sp.]
MLNLLIFGAPGSGKGTQSAFIKAHYNLDHVSTGDMLRGEIKAGSEVGKKAAAIIERGALVSDDIISEMLRKRVSGRNTGNDGFIFDGYPRTIRQAETLEEILSDHGTAVTALVELRVPEEELITRIIERGKISGRADDNETSVKERLSVYHRETEPVIDFYKRQGKVIVIDGTGSIEEITRRITNGIDAFVRKA